MLTAVGVEAEHHLPYSGLHQLLFPLRKEIHGLASTQQEGLRTALGLADAAARGGELRAVEILVQELEMHAATSPSPALHSGLRYARAVLSPDHEAEKLYRAALDADLSAWPLERGRVQLAYGEWLRRQRRVADSRPQLRAARETFDALGIAP